MPKPQDNMAVALTPAAEEILTPLIRHFKTRPWSAERQQPICLICENVDFSGHLVEMNVIDDEEKATLRVWIPHSYVALAFDFSQSKKIGFHS
jgi:hypothetical protein